MEETSERQVLSIGHRGAAGHAAGNTRTSFEKAIRLGADMVELDVQLCQSGEVVVIHDATVDRVTEGQGPVQDKTLAELRSLTIGEEETIPPLSDVLDFIQGKVAVNIELKGEGTAEPTVELLESYLNQSNWTESDFLVSSSHPSELIDFHSLKKEIKLGILIKKKFDSQPLAAEIAAYSLHPEISLVDQDFVNKAHNQQLKVYPWVVNQREEIERMKELGVGGIITDYPERI